MTYDLKTTGLATPVSDSTVVFGTKTGLADAAPVPMAATAWWAYFAAKVAALYYNKTELDTSLSGKAATSHTHAISDTTGLQSALDGKAASSHSHAIGDTTGLQSALDGKAASSHSHAIGDTTGLQTALDGKAASSHSHAISDTTGLQTALDGKLATTSPRILPAGGTTGQALKKVSGTDYDVSWQDDATASGGSGANLSIANRGTTTLDVASDSGTDATLPAATTSLTGLMTAADKTKLDTAPSDIGAALTGKAASSHTHATSEVTGLDTALAGKAASSHTHATSEVTGLDTALAGKAAASHGHTAADISDFTEAAQDVFGALLAADGGDFDWTYNDAGNAVSGVVKAGAITYAKMQDVSAASRILGRKTSGAGVAEELTLSETLDFVGSAAQGDLLYRGASGWARLGAGASGQFLKTLGTGADPAWDTPAGGGSSNYAQSPPAHAPAFGATANSIRGVAFGATGTTATAVVANRLYLAKMHPMKAQTLTKIGVRVTTAGAAGTKVRVGIYECSEDGLPTTLLLDAGFIATDAVAFTEITISQSVAQRPYFLACVFDGTPSMQSVTMGAALLGLKMSGTALAVGYLYRAFTYGTLPADETSQAGNYTEGSGACPAVAWN